MLTYNYRYILYTLEVINVIDPTDRQLEVLRFVNKFKMENYDTPTLNEIAEEMGVTRKTISDHLHALQKKGVIKMESRRTRITIVERKWL